MTENNEKSTEAQKNDHRSTPKASAFTEFIAKDWAKAEDGRLHPRARSRLRS